MKGDVQGFFRKRVPSTDSQSINPTWDGFKMPGMLVVFHSASNTGYAMAPLERMFYQVALTVTASAVDVHFAFKDFKQGHPQSLPSNFTNLIAIDGNDPRTIAAAGQYVKAHGIEYAFCFDLQVSSQLGTSLRRSGVRRIISYWGATISGESRGVRLLLKRLEVALTRLKPDHFIFESEAMRHFAVNGRGIPTNMTSVIPTGIDIQRYRPEKRDRPYLCAEFGIPLDARVIVYSGHMERRKGVHVIIDAAIDLIDRRGVTDVYFLITGNRPGEEAGFIAQMAGRKAKAHVIFGGYRSDLDRVMPSCDVGVIASTGWDSFPMSALEMAASGLPLVVSDLQGLTETVEAGITGITFPPGESRTLASMIVSILGDERKLSDMSRAARERIVQSYSTQHHFEALVACCGRVFD